MGSNNEDTTNTQLVHLLTRLVNSLYELIINSNHLPQYGQKRDDSIKNDFECHWLDRINHPSDVKAEELSSSSLSLKKYSLPFRRICLAELASPTYCLPLSWGSRQNPISDTFIKLANVNKLAMFPLPAWHWILRGKSTDCCGSFQEIKCASINLHRDQFFFLNEEDKPLMKRKWISSLTMPQHFSPYDSFRKPMLT